MKESKNKLFVHGIYIRSISGNTGYCSLKKLVSAFNCNFQSNRAYNLLLLPWGGLR
jgi:hypothetical protein